MWTFGKGAVVGTFVAFLIAAVGSGGVSDIAIGFACGIVLLCLFVATVSGIVLFIVLEFRWRFGRGVPELRSPDFAFWAGIVQGITAIGMAWWSGSNSLPTDEPIVRVLLGIGLGIVMVAGPSGWLLVTRGSAMR